jgi:hypothetical protein
VRNRPSQNYEGFARPTPRPEPASRRQNEKGEPVTAPGVPKNYPEAKKLVTEDCINPRAFAIDGIYRVGTKVVTFQSRLGDAPIAVRCTLGPAPEPENGSMGLEFIYSVQRWQGLPVLHLPFFEQILNILEGMESEQGIRTEFMVRGLRIAEGCHTELKTPDTHRLLKFVSWLGRCRIVATRYGINPKLPRFDTITDEQWELVDDLLALHSGHKRMIALPKLAVRCTTSLTPESEVVKESMFGCLMLDNPEGDLNLLGVPLAIGPLRLTFTNVNIIPLSGYHEGKQSLEIAGTDSTQRLIENY